MKELPSLAITIVTYNSAQYIERCIESIARQDYPNKRIIIVDNASTDSTRECLERLKSGCHIVYNPVNTGFAAAQNQAIQLSEAAWLLVLNPDVVLAPNFLRNLVITGELDKTAGTVCGKLLAISPSLEIPDKPLLDSTGIFLTPELRHLDRGSRIEDRGQYDRFEYVFGATGAAALYRRAMVDDISIGGEFFDSDFFAYREDADVSWRAQLLGWSCVYCPAAVAYHVRTVLPNNRNHLPAVINMHSVKNRWLLRIKNMTGDLYWRFWAPITKRDLLVLGACFTVELGSLPGLFLVAKKWRTMLGKRREIMNRRRVSDPYLAQWISANPVGLPATSLAESFSNALANTNRASD
jgi:GT2 family glycosyltransferase